MKIGPGRTTTLRGRIWRLAVFDSALLLVLFLALAWSLERSRADNAWVQHNQSVLRALSSYSDEIVEAETGQRGYLLTRIPQYLIPFKAVQAGNLAQLQQLRGLITNTEELRKLQVMAGLMSDKLQELAITIRLAEAGNLAAALDVVKDGRGISDTEKFQSLSDEIADSETAALALRQAKADRESLTIQAGMVLGGIFAMLLILASVANTVRQIDGPLGDLMTAIDGVAAGRLERRANVRARDEIGQVAEAFNHMADHLLAATMAQARIEADLASTNMSLASEVADRTAAQVGLSRSVAELRRSNEALDNFAYSASHDLKAPLRGIRNLTAWITADVKDVATADTRENLELLHRRVDRLDMLLDSLLQYSRVGRNGSVAEDVDAAGMVGDIAGYIAPRPGFSINWRGPVPQIHTHKASLEQVLRNLIGNALNHHDLDTGAVSVSARNLGDLVEFRVEDDGPGIAPAYHKRIFQMFQTLKSRDELEGSGMGLAIVQKSVDAHGGTVAVESAPPRRGTAFVFTWEKVTQTE